VGTATKLGLAQTLAAVTSRPAAVLAASAPAMAPAVTGLGEGARADLCLFRPDASWQVEAKALVSRSRHTPFAGYEMPGRVVCTIVGGHVAFESPLLTSPSSSSAS